MSQYESWEYVDRYWESNTIRAADINDTGEYLTIVNDDPAIITRNMDTRPPSKNFSEELASFSMPAAPSTSAGNVLSYRPGTTEFAVGQQSSEQPILDATTDTIVATLEPYTGETWGRGFTWEPNGNRLFFCVGDGIAVYDAANGYTEEYTEIIDSGTSARSADWSPNGDEVAVVTSNDLYFYDPSDWSLSTTGLTFGGTLAGVTYSPDASLVAVGDWGNNLTVIDDSDGSTVFSDSVAGSVYGVMFSPDGEYIAYGEGSGGNDEVYVRDTTNWNRVRSMSAGGPVEDVTFSPDRGHFVHVDRSSLVGIWQTPATRTITANVTLDGSGVGGATVKAVNRSYEGAYEIVSAETDSSGTATLDVPSFHRSMLVAEYDDGSTQYHAEQAAAGDRGNDESVSFELREYTKSDPIEATYADALHTSVSASSTSATTAAPTPAVSTTSSTTVTDPGLSVTATAPTPAMSAAVNTTVSSSAPSVTTAAPSPSAATQTITFDTTVTGTDSPVAETTPLTTTVDITNTGDTTATVSPSLNVTPQHFLEFHSSGDEVTAANNAIVDAWNADKRITISIDFRIDAVNDQTNWQTMWQLAGSSEGSIRFERSNDNDNSVRWTFSETGGNTNTPTAIFNGLTHGELHTLTVVTDFDGSQGGESRAYIDGEQTYSYGEPDVVDWTYEDWQLYYGGWADFSVDRIAYWDRVLSDAEIADHAAGNTPENGVVGQWNLDEGSGSTANDTSGNGNHGTISGSPAWTPRNVAEEVPYALEFAGAGSGDTVDTSYTVSDLGISGSTNRTIMARIQPSNWADDAGIWSLGNAGASGEEFTLRMNTSTEGEWRGQMWGTPDLDFSYGSLDEEFVIGLGYDGNGVIGLGGSDIIAQNSNSISTQPGQTLTLGTWVNSGTDGADYDGLISEIVIYNRFLSPTEREDVVAGNGPESGLVLHWGINAGHGDTVYDRSGNDRDGTVAGPTWTSIEEDP